MKQKTLKKLLALASATILAMSLVACGGNGGGQASSGGGQESTPASESKTGGEETPSEDVGAATESTEPEDLGPFADYIGDEVAEDLGGYVFKIVDFGGDRWVTENADTPQNEMKANIISDVQEKFNCTIEVESVDVNAIYDNGLSAVMSGDKYADLIGTVEHSFGKLLGSDMLLDLSTVDSLDLSAPYFNQAVVNATTFSGHTYALNGGFAPDFGNGNVIFYNDRIWKELNLPDPLSLLENNEWTWDTLLSYAKQAIRDEDGDGVVSSEADRYGIVGAHGGIAENMLVSMGEHFVAPNEDGQIVLALTKDSASEKINYIYDFFWNQNVVCMVNDGDFIDRFAAGGALFAAMGNGSYSQLNEMEDDFGILPLPKWSADQTDYINFVDANTPIFCMTKTNKNTHEAGVIISALARRYQAYQELVLEERAATFYRLDETEDIVNQYVVPHVGYDLINMLKNARDLFGLPTGILWEGVHLNTYTDIPSEYKAQEEAINIALDEYFAAITKE